MLDHQTTIEYVERAQKGDEEAKRLLIVHNIPLIKSIAKRYRNHQNEYEDIMQLGAMGFVKAINNFDVSYNVRFSTYAVPMIAGEIKRFIRDDGAIKVSRVLKTLNYKIQKFIAARQAETAAQPTVEEIAEEFHIDPQEVVVAMDSSKYPVSLFDKYDEDGGQSVIDKLPAEDGEDIVDKIMLRDIIKNLPERERTVIVLRYYRDKTQSEIAAMMGVSQVQISRIENKVLKLLREQMSV